MRKTVTFYTLGCKLNQAETAAIAADFEAHGYKIIPFEKPANVVFINTCSVTERAEQKCRHVVRQAIRNSPNAKIVVAGCYSQLKPDEVADIPGVSLVLGTQNKYEVISLVENLSKTPSPKNRVEPFLRKETFRYFDGGYTDRHTRAFLKIQDGCDYRCSYCSIPFSRGPSRSDHPQSIVARAQALVMQGFKELVLTGVHIGMYGRDLDREENLVRLLRRLLKIGGLERIRLSSLDPHEVSDELINLVASTHRIAPHFHIALQSGDNEILKAMRRAYRVEKFQSVVEKIRSKIPGAGIGVDVIVGFPGETKEKFEATYRVLVESPVTFFHVFSYSKRAGTPAEKFPDQIPKAEKKRRVDDLIQLGNEKKLAFEKRFLGRILHVLIEKREDPQNWQGVAENYIRVFLTQSAPQNEILPVRITEISDGKVWGVPVLGSETTKGGVPHRSEEITISHIPENKSLAKVANLRKVFHS